MNNKQLIEEVTALAAELKAQNPKLVTAEALLLAVKIQTNRILMEAFILGTAKPSALEMIAQFTTKQKEPSSKKQG